MAEVTVTKRTRQQASRLKKLRQRCGVTKLMLAVRLGFGSTQTYDLYERAKSIIRLDRVDDWADAFGLDPLDFVGVVIGVRSLDDVVGAPWSIRDVLKAGGLSTTEIERYADEHEGKPITDQKAIAESILRQTGVMQRTESA